MSNNVITDGFENQIGFYNDLKEMLKDTMINEIKGDNFAAINPEMVELLEDLDKYQDYGGLLVISENNGMGWTVTKYTGEEGEKKGRDDFLTKAGAILAQDLDTYTAELGALMALYEHEEGMKITPPEIRNLKRRADLLAQACDDISGSV